MYESTCAKGDVKIGFLQSFDAQPWQILNFPTKTNWRYPSKIEYLEQGLQTFVNTYSAMNISSIAFPLLGAAKGGLSRETSLGVMEHYLSKCVHLEVEIWDYDPSCSDDLYPKIKKVFDDLDNEAIKASSKLTMASIKKIRTELESSQVNSLQSLSRVRGLGETTLTHLVHYVNHSEAQGSQLSLF